DTRAPLWPFAILVVVSAAIPAHHHSLFMLALPLDAAVLALLLLPDRALGRWLPEYRKPWVVGRRQWMIGLGLAGLGLLPLLYRPIAAARAPVLHWGRPETFPGFLGLLSRAEYGSLTLAPVTSSHAGGANHAWVYLLEIPRDFAWVGAGLAALGLVVLAASA